MNNKKGISLIALIVTIIVLILISSITIYTGGNMMDQARIRNANDRMLTVANAIASHEEELGFADIVVGSISGDYRLLGAEDYEIMGLKDYTDEEHMPPIYVYKSGDSITSNKKEYKLKTPKITRTNSAYKEEDFVYLTHTFYDDTHRENLKIEFDSVKGVNRPLLTEDMMAVKTYFNEDGIVYSEPVKDIYEEDWYDYSTISPNWANVKMNDNTYYVWIPRFAYKIEDFYIGTNLSNIPASAIKVVFLKGTSNYMANEEAIPTGYQVHPAFRYKDQSGKEVNIPGFWIAKYNVNSMVDVLYKVTGEGDSVLGALEEVELEKLHGTSASVVNQLESHLLKNTEWAAVAYLSFATSGKTNDGSSLQNNPSAIMDLNTRQFVAATIDGEIPSNKSANFDIYTVDAEGNLKYGSLELKTKQFGDAMTATSSGTSENSAWFAGKSTKISIATPYIIRGVDDCIFSYSADVRNPVRGAGCRNVLLVNTK